MIELIYQDNFKINAFNGVTADIPNLPTDCTKIAQGSMFDDLETGDSYTFVKTSESIGTWVKDI